MKPSKPKTKNKKTPKIQEHFNMGDQIHCTVTDITGTVTAITEFISGCTLYTMSPTYADANNQDFYAMRAYLVKPNPDSPDIKPFRFALGEQVRDIVTGLKLVVWNRSHQYPGYNRYRCRLVDVNPKKQRLEALQDTITYEEAELQSLGKQQIPAVNKRIDQVQKTVSEINPSPAPESRMSPKG